MKKLISLKKVAISVLIGLVVTIAIYSLTFKADYPDLTQAQNYACADKNTIEDCNFTSKEVNTAGLPLRSKHTDTNALTLDYGFKGPVAPTVVVMLTTTPEFYVNTAIWSIVTFMIIKFMPGKKA